MKIKKNLLSAILCIAMIITLIPIGNVPAFAANTDWDQTYDKTTYTVTPRSTTADLLESDQKGNQNVIESVTRLNINSKITGLGKNAFKGFKNITYVYFIPASTLRYIGPGAFSDMVSLEEIVLPDSVEIIDYEGAFSGCTKLKKITFGKELRAVSAEDFSGTVLETIIVSSENPCFTVENNILYNKDKTELILYPAGKKDSSFTVPSTVKYIREYAFESNRYLETVNIPDSVEFIGERAFSRETVRDKEGYKSLKTVNLTENSRLKEIGMCAFESTELTSFTIPSSVQKLGVAVFNGCKKLKTVKTGKNSCLRTVGEPLFNGCDALEEFTLDGGKYLETINVSLIPAKKIYLGEAPRIAGPGEVKFSVSPGNSSYFVDSSGNVYSKDKKVLIKANKSACPGNFVIPEGVERIADEALKQFDKVKTLTLPSTLKFIGSYAFSEMTGLESVLIPAAVEEIDEYAFSFCYKLKTVSFGKNSKLIRLGRGAFCKTDIESFTVPGNVKYVEAHCFADCRELKELSFENSAAVESISAEGQSFISTGLNDKVSSDGIYYAGDYALFCIGTGSTVNIKEGTKYIADYFYIPDKVSKDITIPASVERIGKSAFAGTYIDSISFTGNSNLKYMHCTAFGSDEYRLTPDENGMIGHVIVSYDNSKNRDRYVNGTKFVIPEGVTSIFGSYGGYKYGTYGRDGIINGVDCDTLVIPASMESIGLLAFGECSFKNIEFKPGSRLKAVDNCAFSNCRSLTEVKFPASVFKLGENPFVDCTGLKKLDFAEPSAMRSLPESLKRDDLYSPLEYLYIPSGVYDAGGTAATKGTEVSPENKYYKAVDDVLFSKDMKTLIKYPPLRSDKEYKIPSDVENIAAEAFKGAKGTSALIFPDTVKHIGDNAFEDSVIRELRFGKNSGLETLGSKVFIDSGIFRINLPAALKYIENDTFDMGTADKTALNCEINAAAGNRYFSSENGVLYNKDKTLLIKYPPFKTDREFKVPESVKKIGGFAFAGVKNLMSADVADGVRIIGEKAFFDPEKLYEIKINEQLSVLEETGNEAFASNPHLMYIVLPLSLRQPGDRLLYGLKDIDYIRLDCRCIDNCKKTSFTEGNKRLTYVIDADSISEEILMNTYESTASYDKREIEKENYGTKIEDCKFPSCENKGYSYKYGAQFDVSCAPYFDSGISTHEIEKSAHTLDLDSIEAAGAADCENTGKLYFRCKDCGALIEDSSLCVNSATAHKPVKKADKAYLKAGPTCTSGSEYYQSCSDCGITLYGEKTFFEGASGTHKFEKKDTDKKYLKSPATCTKAAEYYYSCVYCGQKGEKTFSDGILGTHKFDKKDTDKKYLKAPATCTKAAEYYYSCAYCGQKGEKTFTYGEPSPHTFDKKVRNEKTLKSPETAASGAVYYYSCSVCGAISPDKTFTDPISYKQGDADKDGKITAADARLALRNSVGLEKFDSVQLKASDVDKDGKITAADARIILRVSVGLDKFR